MSAVLTRMLLAIGLIAVPPPVNQPVWELIRMHNYGGCDAMSAVVPLIQLPIAGGGAGGIFWRWWSPHRATRRPRRHVIGSSKSS